MIVDLHSAQTRFPLKVNSRIAAVLLASLLGAASAQADTVTLKSGKTVQGKITQRNDRTIQLDVGLDFPITYYTDEIKDISLDEEKPVKIGASAKAAASSDSVEERKADQLEHEGLVLIDQGDMEGGVKLLREALRLHPRASRHLNLGSILFGNGVSLQKQGKSDEALEVFREAEAQIQKSLSLFDLQGETTFLSQAYNLLGELYANAFDDKTKAKTYYEKSLSFYENAAAKRGLAALQ